MDDHLKKLLDSGYHGVTPDGVPYLWYDRCLTDEGRRIVEAWLLRQWGLE